METAPATTSNLPSKIAGIEKILSDNTGMRTRAEAKTKELLALLPADLAKADLIATDDIDEKLANWQSKLGEAVTYAENNRKPITQFFDEWRSKFTAEEKALGAFKGQIADARAGWQKEKMRREAERKQKDEERLGKDVEKARIEAEVKSQAETDLAGYILTMEGKLQDKFNSQTIESMPSYSVKLNAWEPGYLVTEHAQLGNRALGWARFHTAEEANEIRSTAKYALYGEFKERYLAAIGEKRKSLIAAIPGRVADLTKAATDKETAAEIEAFAAKEKAQREADQAKIQQEGSVAAEVASQVAADNALFNASFVAEPAITVSKGTVVKKKYAPVTPEHHKKIIQFWAANVLPGIDNATALKLLSFMRTAANKALSEGETIEGIPVEDDITPKGRAAKPQANGIE